MHTKYVCRVVGPICTISPLPTFVLEQHILPVIIFMQQKHILQCGEPAQLSFIQLRIDCFSLVSLRRWNLIA